MLTNASGDRIMDNIFCGIFTALSLATAVPAAVCIVDSLPAADRVIATSPDTIEGVNARFNLAANLAGGLGGILVVGFLGAQAARLRSLPQPASRPE